MALRYYANAPATTLSTGCTAGATSITVASVSGFPVTFPYTIIIDRGEATEEVLEVTAAGGTTLTVTRGVDSTTAFAHATAAVVEHGISARDLREPNLHVNSNNNVHGVTGDVVGTTDSQALTNKDLTSATNTLPSQPPIGSVLMWSGSSAPTNYLLCDGSAVSRTTYATLFAVTGTTFGAGNGSTTFNLPDLRDRVAMGVSGTKARGSTGGSATVTLTTTQLPAHTHTTAAHTHTIAHTHNMNHTHSDTGSSGTHDHDTQNSATDGTTNNVIRRGSVSDFTTGNTDQILPAGAHTHTVPSFSGSTGAESNANTNNISSGATTSTGSGSSFSILNPYVALNYIIKAL